MRRLAGIVVVAAVFAVGCGGGGGQAGGDVSTASSSAEATTGTVETTTTTTEPPGPAPVTYEAMNSDGGNWFVQVEVQANYTVDDPDSDIPSECAVEDLPIQGSTITILSISVTNQATRDDRVGRGWPSLKWESMNSTHNFDALRTFSDPASPVERVEAPDPRPDWNCLPAGFLDSESLNLPSLDDATLALNRDVHSGEEFNYSVILYFPPEPNAGRVFAEHHPGHPGEPTLYPIPGAGPVAPDYLVP